MLEEIFGWKPSVINPNMLDEKFNADLNDSDSAFYTSKEVFVHDEDEDLKFKYHYCIEAEYCEGSIYYALYLVPTADSLTEEKLNSVMRCSGLEKEDVTPYDICGYGCNVLFGSYCDNNVEEVNDDILNLIANVFEAMNSLRGFTLDKPQNRIGTNGWDLLYDFIKDEDYIEKTLSRYNEKK